MQMECSVFQAQVMFGLTYVPGTAMELGARRGLRQELCVQLFAQSAPLSIQEDRGGIGVIGDIEAARNVMLTLDLTQEQLELLLHAVGVKQWPPYLGIDLEEAVIGIQAFIQEQLNTMQTMRMIEQLPEDKREEAMAKLSVKEGE